MTATGFKVRAAISAVGATVVAALAVTVCPAAHADEESWGAIAVSLDGQHVGVSKDMPNEIAANKAANFNCQQDNPTCNVMISFKYPECGAIVTTEDQYYRDLGASQREAEQNAINQSPKRTTKVLRSQCNDAPSRR
ncbi:DUF4189 domain-containing protein [Mycobacterium avium]|uniref:DUF4189 domain-containing protein n=1 Tax=Mycobacterium avium TaxID=1764 RepID=UPI0009BD3D67|nr:DUF4189 domain-containing protein [Mycobacterium avium]